MVAAGFGSASGAWFPLGNKVGVHMSHRSSRVVCIATRVVMTLLQVALVAGCFVLNHFANTRMGAARHISWRSVQMERAMDMQLVLLLLGLAVIAM